MLRIAVLGNCQAHGVSHGLAHLLPEAEVVAFEAAVIRNNQRIPGVAQLLRGYDVLFTQEFGPEFGVLRTEKLAEHIPALHRIPVIAFTGYHPDMAYLALEGKVIGSPVGAYHSALIAAAFSLGVPEGDVPTLFNRLIFARLGYLAAFAEARTLMLGLLAGHGLEMEAEFEAWHARGPFMHTMNHPCHFVLADLARAAAIRAGLLAADAPHLVPPHDHLGGDTIWPVYPEIAESLGVPGTRLFKRNSRQTVPRGNTAYIPLRRMIQESYAIYAEKPEAAPAFEEGAVGKVRRKLATIIG